MSDRLDFWKGRWTENKTGWHKKDVNRFLLDHFHEIGQKPNPARVFVPLCGKSVDLKWFYDMGHHVVGVEGFDKAILQFFAENSLQYQTGTENDLFYYATDDGRLKIYYCDFLTIDAKALGKFDIIWDRGSLVAIYPEDRTRYAAILKQVLGPNCSYLINSVVYDKTKFEGPPRPLNEEDIKSLYGDVCDIRVLEVFDANQDPDPAYTPKVRWNLDEFHETLLLLTPREN